LAFVLMITAGGKAGIAAGFLSGILFYAMQKRFKAALGFVVIVLIGFALALKFTALSEYFSTYLKLEQLSSFTGRTGLWTFVWPLILQRPILGYGFNSSRFIAVLYPETPFGSSHMHNSLLETIYNNGALGLIPLLMVLFVIVRNLWRTVQFSASHELRYLAIGCLAAFVNLFVNGMFNATFGGRPDASYMILIALVVISSHLLRISQAQSARQPAFSPAVDSFKTPLLDPLS
jgi:O-antigen ligase